MQTSLTTAILPAGEAAVAAAARMLADGGLVAFPTETVYGLGADATNAAAIARLYQAKGRPAFNPLISHVSDLAAAARSAGSTQTAVRLAEAFWPGPLTLVLPRAAGCAVAELATAGLETIAIRVPRIRSRARSCARSVARWWRHRPISPAMSRQPRRRMCKATSRAAST